MIHVVFDLDGTLSDSAEGITRSINHALVALGGLPRPTQELLPYVGPPLAPTFRTLLGTADEETIAAAIRAYRQRYTTVGFRENRLYDGISDALAELRAEAATLSIATSKREDIARLVVRFLGIEAFFAHIRGCGHGGTKAELLSDLLAGATPTDAAIMVGDRESDFVAARAVGIPSLGVRWGYGNASELRLATQVVERPADLAAAAGTYAQPAVPRCGAR